MARIKRTFFSVVRIEYFPNKEKGVTLCMITSRFNEGLFIESLRFVIPLSIKKELRGMADGTFQVIGRAKLSDGDEWNDRTGRRISESKAKMALYKAECRFYRKIIKCLDSYKCKLNDILRNCGVARDREMWHYQDMCSKE